MNDLSEERQRNLDLEKVEVLNDRRLKELIELEESSKKAFIKDEELVGRQSGKCTYLWEIDKIINSVFKRIFGLAYQSWRDNRTFHYWYREYNEKGGSRKHK